MFKKIRWIYGGVYKQPKLIWVCGDNPRKPHPGKLEKSLGWWFPNEKGSFNEQRIKKITNHGMMIPRVTIVIVRLIPHDIPCFMLPFFSVAQGHKLWYPRFSKAWWIVWGNFQRKPRFLPSTFGGGYHQSRRDSSKDGAKQKMGFRQPAIHLEIETVHTDRSPWFPAKQLEERHHHCTQNLGPVGTPVAIVYIPIAGWSNHVLGGLDSLKKYVCIKWRENGMSLKRPTSFMFIKSHPDRTPRTLYPNPFLGYPRKLYHQWLI